MSTPGRRHTAATEAQRVAFVGLGAMGLPIAQCLVRSGRDVLVYDTRRERVEQAAASGAIPMADMREVSDVDVVAVCVLTEGQLEDVCAELAPHVQASNRGTKVLILSTVRPDVIVGVSQRFGSEVAIVDAPVSGGSDAAVAGQLLAMWSGDVGGLEAMVDTFSARRILVSGRPGDASALKLILNVMSHSNMLVALEAVAFAQRLGVEESLVVEAAGHSTAQSWWTDHWGHMDEVMLGHSNPGSPEMYAQILKDLRLAISLAKESSRPFAIAESAVSAGDSILRERYELLQVRASGEGS